MSKLSKIRAIAVLKTASGIAATGQFVDNTTDKVREGGKRVKAGVGRKVHYAKAVKTAMQAGWIAQKCINDHGVSGMAIAHVTCIIDDENESIIPCRRHQDVIARLFEANEEDYNKSQKED